MIKRTHSLPVVLALVFPVVALSLEGGCSSCKRDDDEVKPVASATAAPVTTTAAPVATIVPEEDAGSPAPDASVDAGKPALGGPGGGASGSIAKCCAALQSNANSAPLDQKGYYMTAATMCNGMRNTPSAQQAFGQLRQFLAGAKMPAACK